MRTDGKRLAITMAACALMSALAVGGTFAYLTDNEGATNTFIVGEVKVDLTEPGYPGNTSDEVKNLVPNQEVEKDPKVTNTGVNDAIIFVTVEVPVKEVTVVGADGTKGAKEVTELFWFKDAADAQGTFANNFNSADWLELTTKETKGAIDGSTTTYVFAHRTAVTKDVTTNALFGKVQLKNVIEGEVTAGAAQDIKVKTYAIQASDVLEGDADLTDGLTEDTLNKIYDIYLKQAETKDTKDATTSNQFDLKGQLRTN